MPDPAPIPITAGWREHVDLPEWGVRRLRAKLDTGARTSAIHVDSIEFLPGGVVRFGVVRSRKPGARPRMLEAPLVRLSRVRPTSGLAQERPVVETTLRMGPVERRIEIGLVSREHMLCRLLLGRRALEGILVDPARKGLLTPRAPLR